MIKYILPAVFAMALIFFMFYPAMLTTNFLKKKFAISSSFSTILTIFFTLLYSLLIGIFLKFF